MAAVLLTALDNKPIADARQLLVSVSGAVRGTQPGSLPKRPVDLVPYRGNREYWTFEPDPASPGQPSGSRDASGPVWVERSGGELRFATSAHAATVYPLDGAGRRMAALRADQVKLENGQLRLPLQTEAAQSSLWYEISLQ